MKYLPLICLSLFLFFLPKGIFYGVDTSSKQNSVQKDAFEVLQNKCNVCHATKKRVDIFTYQNMDSLAEQIHQQVFVKKKMPKGRKVKLTTTEEQHLKSWIASL